MVVDDLAENVPAHGRSVPRLNRLQGGARSMLRRLFSRANWIMGFEPAAAATFIENDKELPLEAGGQFVKASMKERLMRWRQMLQDDPSLRRAALAGLPARGDGVGEEVAQAVAGLQLRRWAYLRDMRDTRSHSVFVELQAEVAYAVMGLTQRLKEVLDESGAMMQAGLLAFWAASTAMDGCPARSGPARATGAALTSGAPVSPGPLAHRCAGGAADVQGVRERSARQDESARPNRSQWSQPAQPSHLWRPCIGSQRAWPRPAQSHSKTKMCSANAGSTWQPWSTATARPSGPSVGG